MNPLKKLFRLKDSFLNLSLVLPFGAQSQEANVRICKLLIQFLLVPIMTSLPLTLTMANINLLSRLTLNYQDLRSATNRSTLFSRLNCVKADVVCLQETHSTSVAEFASWVETESLSGNNNLNYSFLSSPGCTHSSGVAILFKPSLKMERFSGDDDGRMLTAEFSSLTRNQIPIPSYQYIWPKP